MIPGWLSDLVTADGISVFAGALLGALFGWWFTSWQAQLDAVERRAALFRSLYTQLSCYPANKPPFVSGKHNHLDPIGANAVEYLLAAQVLNARKDGLLIEKLSDLSTRIEHLNELGRVYNLTFFTAALYVDVADVTKERESWYVTYSDVYREQFIQRRDEVLSLLPPEIRAQALRGG